MVVVVVGGATALTSFAGATDGVVVVFAAAGVVTDAGVGVVLTAVVVAAALGFTAVVVVAGFGFVAVAVVVADTALASFTGATGDVAVVFVVAD